MGPRRTTLFLRAANAQPLAASSLPTFDRYGQIVLTPQPFDFLVVHAGPRPTQGGARLTAAFPGVLSRVFLQCFDHVGIILLLGLVLKYRPTDPGQRACPTLRNSTCLQLRRRLATLTGL